MNMIIKPNKSDSAYQAVMLAAEIVSDMGVSAVSCLDGRLCRYTRSYLLDFTPSLVLLFTVPYKSEAREKSNISAYAVPRDYHIFFAQLFAVLGEALRERYPGVIFAGFSDHSPIIEAEVAAAAGLGVMGDNGLLITPDYGSYVFIGEVFFAEAGRDRSEVIIGAGPPVTTGCLHCGACSRACPSKEKCLSSLTQKKGRLSPSEEEAIKSSGCLWGCDICQLVCPMNAGKSGTTVPFFREKLIPRLTPELLREMSDEDFSERAYSWRGKETIRRNLELYFREN